MDYNKLCDEILKINPKIRFAGVYNTQINQVYYKMQKGITRYLDEEQTKGSLIKAYMRWKTRGALSDEIGEPIYSMTKYEKVSRATMQCGKDALLMVSTENELDINEILNDVIKLKEKHDDKLYEKGIRQPGLSF